MVLSAADRFGDAEAVVDGPLRLSFTELIERIRCAAGAFADLGIEKGDRVAVWAPNSAEWIIAAFGLLTAGGVLVPVNTRFKTDEAGDIIVRSGAKAVLVQKGFLDQDFTAPAGIPVVDLKSDFLSSGSPFELAVSGTDISDIIFTSGTTGRPKGAMMNHQQTLRMYEEWATLADLREGDRYLQINPYFHTFGLKAGLITSFLRGATMLPVAVFDVDTVVDLIERERITMLPGPPTLYHSLLTVGDKSKLSTLRAGVTGAADIPVELVHRIHGELPFQTLMTGYGLTEAGNVTLSLPGDSFQDVATTAGVPCDGVEVRIADDGEVLVRGYGVMQGYLDDPDATAQAIDDEGWLHTGDLGNFTDGSDGGDPPRPAPLGSQSPRGRLRIVGRKKDMFIVGGFNAYPAEIEGFLLEHPAVAQAAVIGVPDERLGQVGKAFVVAKSKISEDDLLTWCRERMSGFKAPRSIEFLDELPLNATGKSDEGPTSLTSGDIHSMVIASDYRVPDPTRVWPLLERNKAALADIGAHHVLVYTSTHDHGRVLVMIGVHSREPIVELLRSRIFFDWFDEAGVEDIPAVFAGEIIDRFVAEPQSNSQAPGVVVATIASVDDVSTVTAGVHGATDRFAAAGVRKMWIFQAFDDEREVLILSEFSDEEEARHWIDHPDAAAQWTSRTGVGPYPPLFVGRLFDVMRIET